MLLSRAHRPIGALKAIGLSALIKVCGDMLTMLGRDMNASKGDRERVECIVKEAARIIGVSRQDFESVYTDLLIKRLHHVLDNVSHPSIFVCKIF